MRKRTIQILIRLSQSEYDKLLCLSEQTGLGIAPLIRRLILGKEIRARPTEEIMKLVREFSGVGNNINQIARIANTNLTISPEEVRGILDMQRAIWNRIKEL